MSFTTDWKAAKKAFEAATSKSKPSATFLGVFNKGTGIEAALKSADAAKTAGDLNKAIDQFSSAADKYLLTLKSAAADPKSVAPDKKAAYVTAIGKLAADLTGIKTSGAAVAKTLEGSGKKDAVDPAALKLQASAEAHYQLRLDAVVEAKKILAEFKKAVADTEDMVAQARKLRANAIQAKRDSNALLAQVQLNVVLQLVDKGKAKLKQVQDSYQKNLLTESSTIKKSRSDFKDAAKLDAEYKKGYTAKSVKAFAEGTSVTVEIKSLWEEEGKVFGQLEAIHQEIEGLAGGVQKPEVYVERLTKVLENLEKITNSTALVQTKMEGLTRQAKDKTSSVDALRKAMPGWLERVVQAEKDVGSRAQMVKQMRAQATTLPRGAREDDKVDKLAGQITTAADKADQTLQAFTATATATRDAIKNRQAELATENA